MQPMQMLGEFRLLVMFFQRFLSRLFHANPVAHALPPVYEALYRSLCVSLDRSLVRRAARVQYAIRWIRL